LENKHCKNWFKRIAIVIFAYLLEVLADRMEYTMFSQLQGPPWSELSHLSQLPVQGKKSNSMDIARVEIVQLMGQRSTKEDH